MRNTQEGESNSIGFEPLLVSQAQTEAANGDERAASSPERTQTGLLVGVYSDLGVVPQVGRGAPQHRDGPPYLDVGRHALVFVQQRLRRLFRAAERKSERERERESHTERVREWG